MKFTTFNGTFMFLGEERDFSYMQNSQELVIRGLSGNDSAKIVELLEVCDGAMGHLLADKAIQTLDGIPPDTEVDADPIREDEPPAKEPAPAQPPTPQERPAEPKTEPPAETQAAGKKTRKKAPPRTSGKPKAKPEQEELPDPNSMGARIIAVFDGNVELGIPVAKLAELAGLDDKEVPALRTELSRLVERGKLKRASRGVYRLVGGEEPEKAPAEGDASAGGGNGRTTLPDEVRDAKDLFPVIQHYRDAGYANHDDIVARCLTDASEIGCLSGAKNIEDRVRRTLEMMESM